mmetsp:Transcript_70135/g.198802  ORF Transcript_70135/g.198802 Transcript_70135/m.198802 type:complete len:228 (-) Transcript_70135:114-797(-)
MPAWPQSGLPPLVKPRCTAYCAQSSMGDHGTGPSSSHCTRSSRRTSVPVSWKSRTCCSVGFFTFTSSSNGWGTLSMTQRRAEKGSRTWAMGMSMPTICVSRGTSSLGKTMPGLSQRHVLSSSTSVCRVFVWPGVDFTLTTLLPTRLLISEDLPTLGWPTMPSMTRPAATSSCSSGSAAPASAPAASDGASSPPGATGSDSGTPSLATAAGGATVAASSAGLAAFAAA